MARTSMIRLSPPWSSGAVLQHSQAQQLSGQTAPDLPLIVVLQCDHIQFSISGQSAANGTFSVAIAAQPPSGPWSLSVTSDGRPLLQLYDLWFGDLLLFAGQSNVGWPLALYPSQLHLATAQLQNLTPQHLIRCYRSDNDDFKIPGQWLPLSLEHCARWPAMLYHFSQFYRPEEPGVMLGLVDLSWPGSAIDAWTEAPVAACSAWQPGALFAAKLAPWLQQPFAAMVWYQGEQDAMGKAAARYGEQLQHWLRSCRRYAGWDFPLLLVQIAGFGKPGLPDLQHGFVQVRQAQQQFAARTPHCVLVSAADLGAAQDIHPPLKAELARRLALQLHVLMQTEDMTALLPLQAKLHEVTTSVAVLRLPDGVDWQQPEWIEGFFAECPPTGWQAVLARFRADQQYVEISLPPAATRLCYGMAALPTLSLYNTDGLPLCPGIWHLKPDE